MKILRIISLSYFAVLFVFIARAQTGQDSTAVDSLRSHDKIYVVVLVLLTIMMGIIYVLTLLDSRMKKVEKIVGEK